MPLLSALLTALDIIDEAPGLARDVSVAPAPPLRESLLEAVVTSAEEMAEEMAEETAEEMAAELWLALERTELPIDTGSEDIDDAPAVGIALLWALLTELDIIDEAPGLRRDVSVAPAPPLRESLLEALVTSAELWLALVTCAELWLALGSAELGTETGSDEADEAPAVGMALPVLLWALLAMLEDREEAPGLRMDVSVAPAAPVPDSALEGLVT